MKLLNSNEESHYIQLVIFVCLGFLLYFKSFGHAWTFDDYFVILNNQDIRSLKDFINNEYPGRPLRELSSMLDYKLFGFEPKYWHIQNCLIHSINAWLIYVLLMRMSNSKSLSWLSSLLFMVHPIHVEVVAQASHRKDSLCLLFVLTGFYFYLLARSQKSIIYLLISTFAFVLSLLSKENAYAFPLIIIAYELLILDRNLFEKIKYKYTACLVLIMSSSITIYVLYAQYFDHGSKYLLFKSNVIFDYSPSQYFLTLTNAWGFIFAKLFWPVGLSVNYFIVPPTVVLDQRLVFLVLFAFITVVVAYYSYKKTRLVLFFLLWFLIFFLPTSNILPFTTHFVADRYLYIPSLGLCIAMACLSKSLFPKLYIVIASLVIFSFALVTFNQIDVWKDNRSLWENSLKYNPASSGAITNVALLKYADNEEMFLRNILKAISLNPYDPYPYYSLATFYYEKSEYNMAIENYEKFIEQVDRYGVGTYKEFSLTARDKLIEIKAAVNK